LLRPAVPRIHQPEVGQPEVRHDPRGRADVLAQLRGVEDHRGGAQGGVGHGAFSGRRRPKASRGGQVAPLSLCARVGGGYTAPTQEVATFSSRGSARLSWPRSKSPTPSSISTGTR